MVDIHWNVDGNLEWVLRLLEKKILLGLAKSPQLDEVKQLGSSTVTEPVSSATRDSLTRLTQTYATMALVR